jgi:hypothetical protein
MALALKRLGKSIGIFDGGNVPQIGCDAAAIERHKRALSVPKTRSVGFTREPEP